MILIIEDKPERQKLFIKETEMDLDSYSDILDNMTGEKYKQILIELKNDTFDFDKYSVILCHKSAFNDDNIVILSKLENYCKAKNKPLVLFSGGIDVNYYDNSNYETIEINSKVFYSNHLKLFLESKREGKQNILILTYGDKWKLNILLNVLEKVNLLIEKSTKNIISFTRFILDTDYIYLDDLNLDIYEPMKEGNKISIDEIQKIRLDIENHIKRVVIDE